MILNFCTLFNISYLDRGLAMYYSLKDNCDNFHLYIYAFDDETLNFFYANNFPSVTVISLLEFEDNELLEIKPTRSAGEYCWTCTPATIYFCIQKYNLPNCTYIDADLFFFSNPKVLIDEMGNNSVLITEHRYTDKYDQSVESGIYCVQFVTFKNDEFGLKVLKWWRDACIEWCFARAEDGKFGDQKYLDNWPTNFEKVHVLENLGGGVAPWNVQQFSINLKRSKLIIKEKLTGHSTPLVFYHFHGLRFYKNQVVSLTSNYYEIESSVKKYLYTKYVSSILSISYQHKNSIPFAKANGASEDFVGTVITRQYLAKRYLFDLRKSISNIFGKSLANFLKNYHYYNIHDF